MRHVLSSIFTVALASLLLLGSVLFAWLRSEQIVISDEPTVYAAYEPLADRERTLRELGARAYEANCQNCHGAGGRGWDQYPPLTGMAGRFAAPGGRVYVIRLHLDGLATDRWRVPMPPMGHMHDVALAAAINHTLTSFGNQLPPGVQPVTPAEIAVQRGTRLRPTQVAEPRP